MPRARGRERTTGSHSQTDRRRVAPRTASDTHRRPGTASDTVDSRGATQWRTGWFGPWVLWVPFVLAAAGDVVTTWYGVNYAGLTEANVVVLQFGRVLGLVPAMLVLKAGMLAIFGVAYRYVEPGVRWAVPVLGIALNLSVVVLNVAGIVAG